MRVIIAGGRDLHSPYLGDLLADVMATLGPVTEIVSGGATGADYLGEMYAKYQYIPVRQFLPDWSTHGKAAGPIRNRQMAEYGDILVLIWDGKSRGSASMRSEMERLGKPIHEIVVRHPNSVDEPKGGTP